MRRRSVGLALVSLALAVPATAHARPKAAAADPAKVLVVTSTQDALSAAGIASIQAGAASGNYTVTAPAPADVGAQFTPAQPRRLPRGRVPEHWHRQPADRRPARELRGVLQEGRRLRRHRLGRRDRPVLVVPDQPARHALVEPHGRPVRHGQGLRPRPRREQGPPGVLGPDRQLLQLLDQRPRRLARARDRGRGPVRAPAAGQHARWHRRRHDGRQPPDLLLQGLPGRPLVLHRPRQHRRRPSTPTWGRTSRARSAGPRARATRSTATAARRCSRTTSRSRSRRRRT